MLFSAAVAATILRRASDVYKMAGASRRKIECQSDRLPATACADGRMISRGLLSSCHALSAHADENAVMPGPVTASFQLCLHR